MVRVNGAVYLACFIIVLMAQDLAAVQVQLRLYHGRNCVGSGGTRYVTDRSQLGVLNDDSKSLKFTGVWHLYKDEIHKGGVITVAGIDTCLNMHINMEDVVSSVRYAGSSNSDSSALSLYDHTFFKGTQKIYFADDSQLSNFNDKASSLVVTGKDSWTIYEHKNYAGHRECIHPREKNGMWYFEASSLGSPQSSIGNDKISSIRKGCKIID